jgi:hypothetical protein
MKNHTNNSVSRYVFVACLAIALILSQVFKLHMHIVHDDSHPAFGTQQVLDIHPVIKVHEVTDGSQDQNDFQNHHLNDVKVTPDSIAKKVDSFSLDLLLFLFISFFLSSVKTRSVFRKNTRAILISTYYLINPPLRAPPVPSLI